jgi:transcriptional regulator with XRE-family HTH domain
MVYENVLKYAKEKGMTIQGLEKACNLSNGIISKWKGNNNPKLENLLRVAECLDVSIEQLVRE